METVTKGFSAGWLTDLSVFSTFGQSVSQPGVESLNSGNTELKWVNVHSRRKLVEGGAKHRATPNTIASNVTCVDPLSPFLH